MAVLGANSQNVPALLMLAGMDGDAGNKEEAVKKYRTVLDIDAKPFIDVPRKTLVST